eukprot:gnl/Dysnectes_brevis/2698_a3273_1621.p1 GENE.gnl/Dysnectes_brevis/2698_a3273_1621~~gnl/Dysnectes_brevis/2698_a3273_1621.p1  ORF type:complete len:231 (-),score=17.39 gnl/Dysnectes_brevis/2698_a3273_1621:52-744(-)
MLFDISFEGMDIVLASSSPRRYELLKQVGLSFTVKSSPFDENVIDFKDYSTPEEFATAKAAGKAAAVAELYPNSYVIGCDTIVIHETEVGLYSGGKSETRTTSILEKPKTSVECHAMMSCLSGRTHRVCSAAVIICPAISTPEIEIASTRRDIVGTCEVTFDDLPTSLIDAYVTTDDPYDKAGGYGIQSLGAAFITGVNGCYYSVVGLPLQAVCKALREEAAAHRARVGK